MGTGGVKLPTRSRPKTRVDLACIREREAVDGVVEVQHRVAGVSRHRVPMVHARTAGPGRPDQEPIERPVARLVPIEPVRHELAKHPAGLGVAEAQHAVDRPQRPKRLDARTTLER
jgi:hypothetical protein